MRSLVLLLAASTASADGSLADMKPGARASLTADGPWLPLRARSADTLEVRDDTATRPQFVEHVEGAQLFLFVDPAGLRPVVTDPTFLLASEATAAETPNEKRPGMHLAAGTRIERQQPAKHRLARVKIALPDHQLRLDGFVPRANIGKIYKPSDVYPTVAEPTVTLPGRFALLDRPKGKPFAFGTGKTRVDAATLEERDGFTLVQIEASATGWIATKQLQPTEAVYDEGVEGGVVGGVAGGVDHPTLRPGTQLFDKPDGQQVGVVTHGFVASLAKQEPPWSRFDLKTRFGVVKVWATTATTSPGTTPPPSPAVKNIAPSELEKNRTGGTREILPDTATKAEIERAGKNRIVGSWKLCIDEIGRITHVNQLKSTRYFAYDQKIEASIRGWTFRPFVIDGKPAPVCTAVTYVYPP